MTVGDVIHALGPQLVQFGALLIGATIAKHLKTSADNARATALAAIAADCAAAVYANNPKLTWLAQVQATVDAITRASGLPTRNKGAIDRAAKAALVRAGVAPA